MFTYTLDDIKENYEKLMSGCYVICYDCEKSKIPIFVYSDLDVAKKKWEEYQEKDCVKTVVVDLKTMDIIYS